MVKVVVSAIVKFVAANWLAIAVTAASTAISYSQARAAKRDAKKALDAMLNAGRRIDVRFGSTEPRNWIYGTIRVGGVAAVMNTTEYTGSKYNILQVIADHPIDSYEHIYIGSDVAKYSWGTIGTPFISQSQAYFDAMVSDGNQATASAQLKQWFGGDITDAHKFTSCSYFACRYTYDRNQNVWPSGPTQATIVVNGKRVYDPRTELTEWSENPSLCILDYIRNFLNIPDDYIDFGSFIEAANDCEVGISVKTSFTAPNCRIASDAANVIEFHDYELSGSSDNFIKMAYVGLSLPYQTFCEGDIVISAGSMISSVVDVDGTKFVSLDRPVTFTYPITNYIGPVTFGGSATGGGGQLQYTMNGMFLFDESPAETLKSMLSSCRGRLIFDAGKYSLRVAKWREPVVSITDADIIDTYTLNTRTSLKDSYNCIRGTYINPSDMYHTNEFPPMTSSAFIAQDGDVESWLEIDLPWTDSPSTCQRIAKQELYDSRFDRSMTIKTSLKSFGLQPMDNVYVQLSELGWEEPGFIFQVMNVVTNFTENYCELSLKETSHLIYEWSADEETLVSASKSPTFISPTTVPATSSIELSWVSQGLYVNWSDVDAITYSTDVEYTTSGSTSWVTQATVLSTVSSNIIIPVYSGSANYDVRVRNRSYSGVTSNWTSGSI